MASFGWKDFLGNFDREVLFHFHRMTKSMFIGSTSFLSVFQVIAISHRDSRWAEKKDHKNKLGLLHIWTGCWTLFANILTLVHVREKYIKNNKTYPKDLGYWAADPNAKISIMLYAALLSSPDFLFVEIIVWASTSMVLILHRYKLRMQHMPRTNVPSTFSTECRVNKTILLLVSTLICFSHSRAYWLSL